MAGEESSPSNQPSVDSEVGFKDAFLTRESLFFVFLRRLVDRIKDLTVFKLVDPNREDFLKKLSEVNAAFPFAKCFDSVSASVLILLITRWH